ncbi:MAG: hypothetical protein ABW046_00115 [Actinoplanes sp.]
MSDRNGYGAGRPLPCPDCGSPVQPEREQLCPRCGYPLMFLRQDGGGDAHAQSIPRSPDELQDPTSLRAVPAPIPHPRAEVRQLPATGSPCRACGYPNEPSRIRCERCGHELRPARPQARVLSAPLPEQATRAGGLGWLVILLIILAVLSLLALAATLVWWFLA